jgi:hypothetical protein
MPNINIEIIKPKTDPQPEVKPVIVWPTMIDEEEEEPALVELTYYDYGTYKDNDDNWADIADWYNDDVLSVLWQAEKTFLDNKPFHVSPRKTTYKVYGNVNSKVRNTAIEEQFSEDNPDRWERKPLATRPREWRFDGNRWYVGGTYMFIDPATGQSTIASDYSQFNIKTELCTSPDSSTASIDPDSFHDDKARRLKMKYSEDLGVIKPLIYKGLFPGQRLGLRVKDQSKSYGHYVSGSGLGYTYDWIDGIYFCEFDTSDTENYKVTTEPSFNATEVSGKFISPGKYDVGLIPRRWVYVLRYRHQVNPESEYEENVYSGISPTCESNLSFNWGGVDNNAVKTEYNSSTNTLKAYKVESTHYLVFFWGRPPCNFTARWFHEDGQPSAEDTSPVGFYNADENFVGTVDLIWNETFEKAQADFVTAGGSSEDASEILTGGLSGNLHVCSDTTQYFVKIGNESTESFGTMSGISSTCYGGPVITRSSASYSYQGFDLSGFDTQEFGINRLWKVIEDSKAWTDLIKPLRDKAIAMTDNATSASRIDMIPWGVGISPSKAGDLVGVVRIREKAYYVWRKTDEEFTPKVVGSATHPTRFESNDSTGKLGEFTEGNYGTLMDAGTENLYDADYCDLFVGDSGRKLTHVGREVSSVVDEPDEDCSFLYGSHAEGATEGAVKLDAPIFVMLTKERAFDDFTWWDSGLDGWNIRLICRCARCDDEFSPQTADVRNSY